MHDVCLLDEVQKERTAAATAETNTQCMPTNQSKVKSVVGRLIAFSCKVGGVDCASCMTF